MQIAVIYSKPSRRMCASTYGETDEDSAVIAQKVVEGLEFLGHKVKIVEINEDHIDEIARIRAELVFNLIEWCGLDIHLSEIAFGYLRRLKIPVTGSDERMFVLTGDKIRLKNELLRYEIPTPKAMVFATGEEVVPPDLPYPMIVKPSLEHCSMGLGDDALAHSEKDLREIAKRQIATFRQPALAEEFIVGRELLIYLIEEQDEVRVLPIEEIIFLAEKRYAFQTYATKWEENSPEYNSTDVQVAELNDGERMVVEKTAIKAFKKLGLRGYARFDARLKDQTCYLLETNANPSIYDTDDESIPIDGEVIWGIKFTDYLQKIVDSAIWHFQKKEII